MSKEESCLLEQKTVTENSCFEYEENNGEITITGYKCGGIITGFENADDESVLAGRLKITSYTSTDYMDVIIPAYINDKPVTKIGQSAFSVGIMNADGSLSFDITKNVIINSVVIPNTVKEIGVLAFAANRIKNLILSYNIERIGYSAFSYNDLESLYLPNSLVEMSSQAFSVNEKLSYVHLSENLTVISDNVFVYCNISGSLTLNDKITTIEDGAFGSNNISNVYFGKNLKSIGDYAFDNNNLTNVDFPDSLESIGECSFVHNNITGTLTIPDGVTYIGVSAFHSNNISEVIIGKKVNALDRGAFAVGINNNRITKIINKTGKSFNWASVLWWGKDDERYVFETGTVPWHKDGKEYIIEITK